MKKQKLANGKLSAVSFAGGEDWASIKVNRTFRAPCARESLPLTEPVKYLKETIDQCNEFEPGEYLITIICNQDARRVEIPLKLLCLSEHQQAELILHGLVDQDYFKNQEEDGDGYYPKPDDPYLLHQLEEEI